MKLKMTVYAALNFADEWSKGLTLHEGSEGWRVVCMVLASEVRALRKDAERYRWLRKHYGSVNFEPGDHDGMDLVFCVPQGEVSANCDKTVDALMQGANDQVQP